MKEKKHIGLALESELHECLRYLAVNKEFTNKTSYLKKLIVQDIKNKSNDDVKLKKMFNKYIEKYLN